jgi:hypothetical protein
VGNPGNSSPPVSAAENQDPILPGSTSGQPKSGVCSALTKAGNPCRAAATKEGLCFLHANPEKASELGRIGGRKKRGGVAELDPLPPLDSAAAICRSLAQLAEEVRSGKVDPKVPDDFSKF